MIALGLVDINHTHKCIMWVMRKWMNSWEVTWHLILAVQPPDAQRESPELYNVKVGFLNPSCPSMRHYNPTAFSYFLFMEAEIQ